MARIRSVHPGLFTDETFVAMSDAAQIFYIGLLTEADDQGVFEWKPVTLKMRLRPASTQTVDGLLTEIAIAEKIASYEAGGRKYGVIRNFRKFQRPKSPNAIHPLLVEWRTYVGLDDVISETAVDEPPPIPPNGEINPQMEEGGGRGEEASSETIVSSEAGRQRSQKSKRRPRVPLPSGYKLSDEGAKYAKRKGLSQSEIIREFEKFCNNASQNDRVCADWESAWRNWVIKALEFAGREPAGEVVSINPAGFHAKLDSPQYCAWQLEKQKTIADWAATDRDGGWWFPTEWPPGYDEDGMPDFCKRVAP